VHTLHSVGQSFAPIRLEYVPYMRHLLLAPLRSRGSDGVDQVP
jgi:hypothetical protein